jgi:hypothetical protein
MLAYTLTSILIVVPYYCEKYNFYFASACIDEKHFGFTYVSLPASVTSSSSLSSSSYSYSYSSFSSSCSSSSLSSSSFYPCFCRYSHFLSTELTRSCEEWDFVCNLFSVSQSRRSSSRHLQSSSSSLWSSSSPFHSLLFLSLLFVHSKHSQTPSPETLMKPNGEMQRRKSKSKRKRKRKRKRNGKRRRKRKGRGQVVLLMLIILSLSFDSQPIKPGSR